ncbi:MAG TPA: alpha/beta hydrolase [Burkholderiales bacterium]|nr:alpha/beta hydrolase [Burkholderiales bacterium]
MNRNSLRAAGAAAILAVAACNSMPAGERSRAGPMVVAEQGYFFIGGRYTKTKDGQIMTGQMYVQYQIPQNRTQPYPVVMWHGGGQTGTNFLGTPDGRKGWADYFLEQGYAVYVVDQPARARSGYFTDVYGETRRPNTAAMSRRFTAPELHGDYPQAKLHTQWPGKGVPGDPVFDQFFASQVEDIRDVGVIEQLNREAGVALLDKIGAAILLTHSQSGPFGWGVADTRPALVKGILAIEPNGPPFYENTAIGAPNWFEDGALGRAWGITRGPLTFAPAAASAKDLNMTREAAPAGPGLVRCWLPGGAVRELPNLKAIPILIVVSEASYHAPYDHCTSRFLAQAGVKHDFVRLPDIGIKGNGHMMMLEKNNMDIAGFVEGWARKNIR